MGGEGSGRKPSVETMIKRSQPVITPIGSDVFLPNYSGIKDEAKKTSAVDITGGGSGAVDSVFTRTGAVVAVSGDYDHSEISSSGANTHIQLDIVASNYAKTSGAVIVNAANIVTISGAHTTLSGAYYTHAADSSDPHGALLTQTNLTATAQVSGSKINVTSDFETISGAYVANVVYGIGSTPPAASGFTRGTIYVEYTP